MSDALLVQKYGGSSVADVARIGAVAARIAADRAAGNSVVAVVSAMRHPTHERPAPPPPVTGGALPASPEQAALLRTGVFPSGALSARGPPRLVGAT